MSSEGGASTSSFFYFQQRQHRMKHKIVRVQGNTICKIQYQNNQIGVDMGVNR